MKDGSLYINIFESNNCFEDRNIFQNGVDAFQKQITYFWPKAENFILFGLSDFGQILLACGITLLMELQIEFQTSNVSKSAFAKLSRNILL